MNCVILVWYWLDLTFWAPCSFFLRGLFVMILLKMCFLFTVTTFVLQVRSHTQTHTNMACARVWCVDIDKSVVTIENILGHKCEGPFSFQYAISKVFHLGMFWKTGVLPFQIFPTVLRLYMLRNTCVPTGISLVVLSDTINCTSALYKLMSFSNTCIIYRSWLWH